MRIGFLYSAWVILICLVPSALSVRAALIESGSGELATRRVLVVCVNFQREDGEPSDFDLYDRQSIEDFLGRVHCWHDCLQLILVPEVGYSDSACEDAARDLGAICWILDDSTRAKYGLIDQPSFCVLEADHDTPVPIPVGAQGRLKNLPASIFRSQGRVALLIDRSTGDQSTILLRHTNCHEISFSISGDSFLEDVPWGTYEVVDDARSITTCEVVAGEKTTVSITAFQLTGLSPGASSTSAEIASQTATKSSSDSGNKLKPDGGTDPEGANSAPKGGQIRTPPRTTGGYQTPSNFRTFGPTKAGIVFGVQMIPFWIEGRQIWQGVFAAGLSARYLGVLGFEAHVYTADTLQSFEGGHAGVDLCPSVLCLGNIASLTLKGGALWVKPKMIGPMETRRRIDYLAPYGGAGLFLGAVGRERYRSRARIGIVVSAIYSEPKEYWLSGSGSASPQRIRLGGWSGGLHFQAEF